MVIPVVKILPVSFTSQLFQILDECAHEEVLFDNSRERTQTVGRRADQVDRRRGVASVVLLKQRSKRQCSVKQCLVDLRKKV